MQLCRNCGSVGSGREAFCMDCGQPLNADITPRESSSDRTFRTARGSSVNFAVQGSSATPGGKLLAFSGGGRYYFNNADQTCPRCGRQAVSAIGQTDAMLQEQRKTNRWFMYLFLLRR
jgi:predicted amidophosphoribosyltransferase